MKAMKGASLPECREKCGRRVQSKRSKLCSICFGKQAAKTGARSAGNKNGNPDNAGNAAGNPDNAGNVDAVGNPGNAGNVHAAGNPDNAGNVDGNPDNAGNKTRGAVKKRAGKRSGVRRSATKALVVKKEWLDLILDGEKTWEIRGSSVIQREYIHLAESKETGMIKGRARLVDSFRLTKALFEKHRNRHHLAKWADVKYKKPHAWIFEDAERFSKPFVFEHAQGAVIWVDTRGRRARS